MQASEEGVVGREWTEAEWQASRRDMADLAIDELQALAMKPNCWGVPVEKAVSVAFSILTSSKLPIEGDVESSVREMFEAMQRDYLELIRQDLPRPIVRKQVRAMLRRLEY